LPRLDALSKFHTEPQVRKVLLDALSTQKDPMVQIRFDSADGQNEREISGE
jgi:hypothetical protein